VPLNSNSRTPGRVMITSDAVGGVWTYTLELTRYLSERDIDVRISVLGPAPSEAQVEEASAAGAESVDVTGLPLDWTAGSEREIDIAAEQLQARALAWQADLVHLNAPAHAGTKTWRQPIVVTVHSCVGTWWAAAGQGALPPDLAWRAARTARGIEIASAVIAPSAAFARDLACVYGVAISVAPIHNGRRLVPAALRQPRGNIVLTAGRLWDRGKNVCTIDEAARHTRIPIYAAGPLSGPNAESAHLPNLHYLGVLDGAEMRTWHARAGVFVSTSKYEPFGLAVLEAAQSGAALVLSDIPTFRELWNGAALFVDPDDAVGLAQVLIQLTTRPQERAVLANAAAVRARRYSVTSMGACTLGIYEKLLDVSACNAAEGMCA
jgi:glycosyltransferase involved in cell wall biosynthesis